MNRLMHMFQKRRTLLRFAPFVAALTAFFLLGINVPYAGADHQGRQGKEEPKNSHDYYKIRDPKVDHKLSPAQRARVQRDAAHKKRQDHQKAVQDIMSGKQPARSGGGDK
jgi:hypothetical protein